MGLSVLPAHRISRSSTQADRNSGPPPERMADFINFWKNVSIAGGFLMVAAFGPGRYSVGRS